MEESCSATKAEREVDPGIPGSSYLILDSPAMWDTGTPYLILDTP